MRWGEIRDARWVERWMGGRAGDVDGGLLQLGRRRSVPRQVGVERLCATWRIVTSRIGLPGVWMTGGGGCSGIARSGSKSCLARACGCSFKNYGPSSVSLASPQKKLGAEVGFQV